MWEQQEVGWTTEEMQLIPHHNPIKWMQTKRTNNHDQDISEWQQPNFTYRHHPKHPLRPTPKHTIKQAQPNKKYSYCLGVLNEEEQSNESQLFEKYEKLPSYRIERQEEGGQTARRVNLKLSLPRSLGTDQSHWRDTSLPLIRKVVGPISCWRSEHRRSRGDIQSLSQVLSNEMRSAREGRAGLLGQTRRHMKCFAKKPTSHSSTQNQLKECISFLK